MISLKIFEFLCENIKRSINYLSLFNALSWLELYRPGAKYEQDPKFFGKRKCLLNTKCIVLLNMAQNRRKILCRYSKFQTCWLSIIILVVDALKRDHHNTAVEVKRRSVAPCQQEAAVSLNTASSFYQVQCHLYRHHQRCIDRSRTLSSCSAYL